MVTNRPRLNRFRRIRKANRRGRIWPPDIINILRNHSRWIADLKINANIAFGPGSAWSYGEAFPSRTLIPERKPDPGNRPDTVYTRVGVDCRHRIPEFNRRRI